MGPREEEHFPVGWVCSTYETLCSLQWVTSTTITICILVFRACCNMVGHLNWPRQPLRWSLIQLFIFLLLSFQNLIQIFQGVVGREAKSGFICHPKEEPISILPHLLGSLQHVVQKRENPALREMHLASTFASDQEGDVPPDNFFLGSFKGP